MASIQCPHCRHEASVPSLEPLLGKNVKCPSCNQSFTVSSDSSPVIQTGAPAAMAAPNAYAPRRQKSNRAWYLPLEYDPTAATSAGRYPNLLRYIGIIEVLQKVFFWIAVVLGILYGVAVILMGAYTIFTADMLLGLGIIFGGAIGVALYMGIVWLGYISAMAGTVFLRVFIDVENNTRQ